MCNVPVWSSQIALGAQKGTSSKILPPPLSPLFATEKVDLDKTNALKSSKSCHCLSLAKQSMIILVYVYNNSLCFLAWSEKQDGRPGLWLAETFSTSPLKPLNRIQRHLTGSKISMSSTKFVFFGPIRKTNGRPGLIFSIIMHNFTAI